MAKSAVSTRRAMLAGLAGLSGCKLIDQTTFNPDAGRPPVYPKPPPPLLPIAPERGTPALLSIRLPTTARLRADIAKAVAAARARKRDVVFEVVEIAPESTMATRTGAEATPIGADATEVARLITAQGVPASRVHLAVRPIPGVAREVRVYVH